MDRTNNFLSNIDLTKSSNSNFPYMSRSNMQKKYDAENDLPLEPVASEWQIEDRKMTRMYAFQNRNNYSYFLNNLLSHAAAAGHDPIVHMKYPNINIVLHTDSVGDVTELDIEFAEFLDEVYEDTVFLSEEF